MAEAIAEEKGKDPTGILRGLRNREKQQAELIRLRGLSRKPKGGKVIKIYQTVDGIRQELTSKDDMEMVNMTEQIA